MSNQQTQLSIMVTGGFDVHQTSTILGSMKHNINPEMLVLLKEQVEQDLANPCKYCQHNDTTDPHILDFCHAVCKEPDIEPIVLTDEIV